MLGFEVFGEEIDGYKAKTYRHWDLEWVTKAYGYGSDLGYDLCSRIKEHLKGPIECLNGQRVEVTGNELESICTLLLKGPITYTWQEPGEGVKLAGKSLEGGKKHTVTVDLSKHVGRANVFYSHPRPWQ